LKGWEMGKGFIYTPQLHINFVIHLTRRWITLRQTSMRQAKVTVVQNGRE
jgi:hypothetical protein